ncbi:Arm DNA-binding domain-containing protein [Longitalea luteola]|uniref:Arm DNA-binding domain-containing protein n=1 Tax=Longitalea luteola TaxID=2812563 RepID=UPI001A970D76|nr:Arm DNA-binding domain-containing protein [Longitalea luteola]
MTSSGTFGVHFVLRSNRQQDGKSAVYARITVNGTRCELALKEYLSPADWDAGKGMAMPAQILAEPFTIPSISCRQITTASTRKRISYNEYYIGEN